MIFSPSLWEPSSSWSSPSSCEYPAGVGATRPALFWLAPSCLSCLSRPAFSFSRSSLPFPADTDAAGDGTLPRGVGRAIAGQTTHAGTESS